MKSTQIFKDEAVSTVFIEPFNYYETAIWDKKERKWEIFGHDLKEEDARIRFDKAVAQQSKDK